MLDNISLSLSDILGYTSIACWFGAQFPQVVENIQRQSCEGLALPFLANWLLGDISNLVGCILTHQLPFQKWLATYFVCVDLTLVVQYMYYYKPSKGPLSAYGHIRSATSPAAIRRMSIDRGASRYRALSVAASNVAAAAALAAQQEELPEARRRYAHKQNRRRALDGSTPRGQGLDDAEEYYEEDIPSEMFNSFHSEGGRDYRSKRVSWSIERHGGRASSMGRSDRPTTPTALEVIANDLPTQTSPFSNDHEASHRGRDRTLMESSESLTQPTNSRSNRASRKGSTMVFLGVWTLFGIGALTNGRRGFPSQKLTSIGRVMTNYDSSSISTTFPTHILHSRHQANDDNDDNVIRLEFSKISLGPEDTPHEDPSSQQILGRVFAWLCTTLYLTSRLPQIWKNFARKSVEGLSMYLFVFAFLGNVFYVASIIASPRRSAPPPESTQYIRESIPYLLGSAGTLIFDITIVGQSFCYRHRPRRHNPILHGRIVDEEAAGLLSSDALSEHPSGDSAFANRGRTPQSRNTNQ